MSNQLMHATLLHFFLLRDRSKFMLHFVQNNVPLRKTSQVISVART